MLSLPFISTAQTTNSMEKGGRTIKQASRYKRANAILAAVVVITISSIAVLVLTTLNTTIDFKDRIKTEVKERYDAETYVALILDDAMGQVREATASVSGVLTCGECSALLASLQGEFAPSNVFPTTDIERLPDSLDLPAEYQSQLISVLGKNANAKADCYLETDLEIDKAVLEQPLTGADMIPLEPFEVTVTLKARTLNCVRTWEVIGAYLLVSGGPDTYQGSISLDQADFTIIDSYI